MHTSCLEAFTLSQSLTNPLIQGWLSEVISEAHHIPKTAEEEEDR